MRVRRKAVVYWKTVASQSIKGVIIEHMQVPPMVGKPLQCACLQSCRVSEQWRKYQNVAFVKLGKEKGLRNTSVRYN